MGYQWNKRNDYFKLLLKNNELAEELIHEEAAESEQRLINTKISVILNELGDLYTSEIDDRIKDNWYKEREGYSYEASFVDETHYEISAGEFDPLRWAWDEVYNDEQKSIILSYSEKLTEARLDDDEGNFFDDQLLRYDFKELMSHCWSDYSDLLNAAFKYESEKGDIDD